MLFRGRRLRHWVTTVPCGAEGKDVVMIVPWYHARPVLSKTLFAEVTAMNAFQPDQLANNYANLRRRQETVVHLR